MEQLFTPVDPSQEAAIVASSNAKRGSNKPDLSIRTVTQWFKLHHQLGEDEVCNVPEHADNVPDGYNKNSRMTVAIGSLNVCRWCFLAGAGKDS
jgi:hypothetical protein